MAAFAWICAADATDRTAPSADTRAPGPCGEPGGRARCARCRRARAATRADRRRVRGRCRASPALQPETSRAAAAIRERQRLQLGGVELDHHARGTVRGRVARRRPSRARARAAPATRSAPRHRAACARRRTEQPTAGSSAAKSQGASSSRRRRVSTTQNHDSGGLRVAVASFSPTERRAEDGSGRALALRRGCLALDAAAIAGAPSERERPSRSTARSPTPTGSTRTIPTGRSRCSSNTRSSPTPLMPSRTPAPHGPRTASSWHSPATIQPRGSPESSSSKKTAPFCANSSTADSRIPPWTRPTG